MDPTASLNPRVNKVFVPASLILWAEECIYTHIQSYIHNISIFIYVHIFHIEYVILCGVENRALDQFY